MKIVFVYFIVFLVAKAVASLVVASAFANGNAPESCTISGAGQGKVICTPKP